MWFIIILVAILFTVIVFMALSGPDCPRMILGYRCKGRDCDHSPEAIREARRAIR